VDCPSTALSTVWSTRKGERACEPSRFKTSRVRVGQAPPPARPRVTSRAAPDYAVFSRPASTRPRKLPAPPTYLQTSAGAEAVKGALRPTPLGVDGLHPGALIAGRSAGRGMS